MRERKMMNGIVAIHLMMALLLAIPGALAQQGSTNTSHGAPDPIRFYVGELEVSDVNRGEYVDVLTVVPNASSFWREYRYCHDAWQECRDLTLSNVSNQIEVWNETHVRMVERLQVPTHAPHNGIFHYTVFDGTEDNGTLTPGTYVVGQLRISAYYTMNDVAIITNEGASLTGNDDKVGDENHVRETPWPAWLTTIAILFAAGGLNGGQSRRPGGSNEPHTESKMPVRGESEPSRDDSELESKSVPENHHVCRNGRVRAGSKDTCPACSLTGMFG